MRFTRIKVTDKVVELDWTVTTASGDTQSVELESANRPMPSLLQALASFREYVVALLDLPAWGDELRVTTINLDEGGKSGRRGLIVTAVRPIEKASGRVLVLNTPRMSEGADDSESEHVLTPETLELIARAEMAATQYVNGEREQTELPLTPPASAEPTDDLGKRRRRAKKGEFIPEVGAQSGGTIPPPSDEALRAVLLTLGRDVPLEAVARWTQTERDDVRVWANNGAAAFGGRLPEGDEPAVLVRDATPSLLDEHIARSEGQNDEDLANALREDGWTSEKAPPKASDVNAVNASER